MILNRDDALYAANVFVDYFSNFHRIDDYLRRVKLERMENYPTSLPGLGPEDDMFSDFDMHPNDMEFECREVSSEIFVNYLEITTSHAVEVSVPGKSIKWVVYEKWEAGASVTVDRFGALYDTLTLQRNPTGG